MPDSRAAFYSPALQPTQALEILNALKGDFQHAVAADMRIVTLPQGGNVAILLPHWTERPNISEKDGGWILGQFSGAVDSCLKGHFDPRRTGTLKFDFEHALPLRYAPAALLALAKGGRPDGEPQGNKIAIIEGEPDAVAKDVATVIRRARGVRILADGGSVDTLLAVASLDDDPLNGATLDGAQAGDALKVTRILAPLYIASDGGWIYVDDGHLPEGDALGKAGNVLGLLRGCGQISDEERNWAAYADEKGQLTILSLEQMPAEEAPDFLQEGLEKDEGLPPALPYRIIRPVPNEEAKENLVQRITARDFPVGYRVGLRRLKPHDFAEVDASRVREQIEELEARIDMMEALAAPQCRLMRFADDQLPALVDALRRVPPKALADRQILYGSGHSAGRIGPSHYLLFAPGEAARLFPEHTWRGRTDDGPITYWLDPYCARMAADHRDLRTRIFVPEECCLVPALTGFGGDLEATLRLLLGNLFVYAREIIENPEAWPFFIFSELGNRTFDMEVELINGRSFAPVTDKVRWLDNYLQVRAAQVVDEDDLQAVAEALYTKKASKDIRASAASTVVELLDDWNDYFSDLNERLGQLLKAFAVDIEKTEVRMSQSLEFMESAGQRLRAIEQITEEFQVLSQSGAATLADLEKVAADLQDRRDIFADRLTAELDASERLVATAKLKISDQSNEISRLKEWAKQKTR